MKAKLFDTIRLLIPVDGELTTLMFPAGTEGVIVEIFTDPREGYAVDFSIPNETVVGGFTYDNMILAPEQFELVKSEGDEALSNIEQVTLRDLTELLQT